MEGTFGISSRLLIALTNFGCPGIGYLLTKRRLRWLISMGLNLVLFLTGHLMNASKNPFLWAAVFLSIWVGMAVDLWLLEGKEPTRLSPNLTEKKFILPIIVTAVLLFTFGGFSAYRFAGNRLINRGQSAYESGEYTSSYKDLYTAESLYRLSLNPRVVEIRPLVDEVSALVAVKSYLKNGEYQSALDGVAKFHQFFNDSPKIPEMNNMAIDADLAWAKNLQSNTDYESSLQHFESILSNFPLEAASRMSEINEAMSLNYFEWGNSLASSGSFESAIEKLEIVVNKHKDSSVFDQAFEAAAQAHYDFAKQLSNTKDYQAAVNHLLIVVNDYKRTGASIPAFKDFPNVLIKWGDALRSENRYLDALEKYAQVADYTNDARILTSAEEQILSATMELARDSGDDGQVIIEKARLYACGEEPVVDASIDVFPDEQGKALSCTDYDVNYIPEDLRADIPGTFRYVVTFVDAARRVQSCDYTTSTDSRVLERWQYGISVAVKKITSGEQVAQKVFYGSSPDSCPYEYLFSYMTEQIWGEYYKDETIRDWLAGVIK